MEPINLSLVHVGSKGLELAKTYPENLPKPILDAITYKSMPLGSKPGDFTASKIGRLYFTSYIIKLAIENDRDNIAALVLLFSNDKYKRETIKEIFRRVSDELEKKDLLRSEIVEKLMPSLYKGFKEDTIKINFKNGFKLDINFKALENHGKERISIDDDIW